MFACLRSSAPPGITPNHAAKSRPLRNAAPLPIVAMIAVAVTGPTPGIATSRWQASFSRAICIDGSISPIDLLGQLLELQLQRRRGVKALPPTAST